GRRGAPTTLSIEAFWDDTVGTLRRKLAAALRVRPADVYVWVSKPVQTDAFRRDFVHNLMRGRLVVSAAEASAAYAGIGGQRLAFDEEVVRGAAVTEALSNCRGCRAALEPLSVRYSHNGFPVYVPVDPFTLRADAAS